VMIYYAYDAMAPIAVPFQTLTEAIACGDAMIAEYREYASVDGWGDVSISVFACEAESENPDEDGKQVAFAKEIVIAEKPNDLDEDSYSQETGEWWNPDWDYLCDFKMEQKP